MIVPVQPDPRPSTETCRQHCQGNEHHVRHLSLSRLSDQEPISGAQMMLRSVYQRIFACFRTNRRPQAPHRTRGTRWGTQCPGSGSRRLAVESLESRQLLTVTALTVNSISDGNFAAPGVGRQPVPGDVGTDRVCFQFALAVLGNCRGGPRMTAIFTEKNPKAPSGKQVAFIQDRASISQTVVSRTPVSTTFRCSPLQGGNYQPPESGSDNRGPDR